MAATDARPVPRKNVAYRVTFPILDNDGDGVTGAAGLDSEVSKDAGALADCTNEATEIGGGWYYLDLTSTEMNADTVAVVVKTSTTDAKSTYISLYPEEAGDFRADVTHWKGSTAPDNTGDAYAIVSSGTHGNAALKTLIDAVDNFLDTEIAAILAAVDTEVAAILADTNELQTDWADGGRLDLILDARASQASVDTIDDFLDTEVAAILAAVDTEVAAIKAKTDSLTFTVAGAVDANVQRVNDVALVGDGNATPWGPA